MNTPTPTYPARWFTTPKNYPTTGEEPDAEKRKQRSQGKTKQEILSREGAWTIQLIEDLPNIPRAAEDEAEKQKESKAAGLNWTQAEHPIKKYVKKGETIPSPQEYLKALQNDPIYQHEQGMTPEDQLTYAILHLEQTDQVIDDWQGNGSASYQPGAYLPASGTVPSAFLGPRRPAGLLGQGRSRHLAMTFWRSFRGES